jgi:hypothetical protein
MRFDLDYFEIFFVLSLKTIFVTSFDKLEIIETKNKKVVKLKQTQK